MYQPPVTADMKAAAKAQPGGWLTCIDPIFGDPNGEIPGWGVVGAYRVDEQGEIHEFKSNENFRPSPGVLGLPAPKSRLEQVYQLFYTGHASKEQLYEVLLDADLFVYSVAEPADARFVLSGVEIEVVMAATSQERIQDFANPEIAPKALPMGTRDLLPMIPGTYLRLDPSCDQSPQILVDNLMEFAGLAAPEAAAPEAMSWPSEGSPTHQQTPSHPKTPAQQHSPDPQQASEPTPVDAHERFMGSLFAGAVGDALGYAIEFQSIDMIRDNHGQSGLTEPVTQDGVAQISDDTQMMLFTLEGLIRGHVARRLQPVDSDPVPEVQHAYQRWFHTQNQSWQRAAGPYAKHLQRPDGWLITQPGLFAARAPGSTCMSALALFAQTHQHATFDHKINDSKGCGGVMRAAPVAVWSNDPAEVFQAAVGTAALTHSHPSGYLSAGVLATIVHQLIRDVPLADCVVLALELLRRWKGHEEQLHMVQAAEELAKQGPVTPEEIREKLGQGWVGEEALAIGLYATLATDNLPDALLLSVNHSGDSDSTGIVCGNIAGAVYGTRAIPENWFGTLELRDVIRQLGHDALVEFSPRPRTDSTWSQRYPAW